MGGCAYVGVWVQSALTLLVHLTGVHTGWKTELVGHDLG